jgi:hypothetical protein
MLKPRFSQEPSLHCTVSACILAYSLGTWALLPKVLNLIQQNVDNPHIAKQISRVGIEAENTVIVLWRQFSCVTKCIACKTGWITVKASSRTEIDMSSHVKMTHPTCFTRDHVTLWDWSARFVSKYLTAYRCLNQLDFLKASCGTYLPCHIRQALSSRCVSYVHTWILLAFSLHSSTVI